MMEMERERERGICTFRAAKSSPLSVPLLLTAPLATTGTTPLPPHSTVALRHHYNCTAPHCVALRPHATTKMERREREGGKEAAPGGREGVSGAEKRCVLGRRLRGSEVDRELEKWRGGLHFLARV